MLLARLRSADWITAGTPQEKAKMDVDTIYRDRAAWVKRYLELNWPDYHLHDAMFNTEMGDSFVAKMLVHCVQRVSRRTQKGFNHPEFTVSRSP